MSTEIDYEIFWTWACEKFGEDNCYQAGPEVCINSPFVPDYDPDRGNHLWCNPSKGVYHCWKTETSGTLIRLVMEIEGCEYPDAQEILGGDRALHKLQEKLIAFLTAKKKIEKKPVTESVKSLLTLPTDTFKITALSPENRLRILATEYLEKRKIPIDGLYICGNGKYAMRIIIPYYGPNGQLIYFNGRDITNKAKLRYRGPEKEVGVGKGDVVWMKEWPGEGSTIHLTEGEFDAMSLCQAGFNGAAIGGKNFSDKQLQLVKQYNMTICFDLDKYGLEALNKVASTHSKHHCVSGKNSIIKYVKPAKGHKDWNSMLISLGAGVVHGYIKKYEKPIDWYESIKLNYGIQ
jgi:DNA primase